MMDPSAHIVSRLGRLAGGGTESVSDAELLRRYVGVRDAAAFAALVRRHGPMVWGVCCRTLGHVQDAEDAFQATFLILARKARAVRPETVGRWLYGVAVRVANKARVRRARRMAVQRELGPAAEPTAPAESAPRDWLPLLDAALARLSRRDRAPIVLCDLMGRSRADAAAELGIAEGTLSSRLARSREKLRARLARLGADLSVPAIAAGLAVEATATVPAALIPSTVTGGASAAAASELAEGVMRTMFLTKMLKLAAVGVCAIGAVTAGVVWLPAGGDTTKTGTGLAVVAAAPEPENQPKKENKRLRELQEARVKALETQLEGQLERVNIGRDPLIVFLDAVRELAEARLELADTHDKRLAAVEEMVKTLRDAEEQITQLHQAGLQTKQGVAQATAARLKAEIQLEKLKPEK